VRRRRDQHAPWRPRRDPRGCGAAIGAGRKVMRPRRRSRDRSARCRSPIRFQAA
jgi:hypothetical protein